MQILFHMVKPNAILNAISHKGQSLVGKSLHRPRGRDSAGQGLGSLIESRPLSISAASNYKNLVFGGAGRGHIFAPILPSNHREEV